MAIQVLDMTIQAEQGQILSSHAHAGLTFTGVGDGGPYPSV